MSDTPLSNKDLERLRIICEGDENRMDRALLARSFADLEHEYQEKKLSIGEPLATTSYNNKVQKTTRRLQSQGLSLVETTQARKDAIAMWGPPTAQIKTGDEHNSNKPPSKDGQQL